MGADVYSRKNCRICADVCSVADDYPLDLELCGDYRKIKRNAGMRGSEHFGSWSPANKIFENEIACVKIRMRPDPYMIADATSSIKTTLDHRMCSDED